MKKIVTLTALALVLTGCSNTENPKNKSVSVESLDTESKGSKEESKKVNTTSTEKISVDNIDYASAEKVLKLYTGIKTLPAPPVMAIELGEKDDNAYKVKLSKLIDAYNAIEKRVVSKEEVLKNFSSMSSGLERISSSYDANLVKEKGGSKNIVLYFEGDNTVVLNAFPPVGATSGYVYADKSQWKIDSDSITVPLKTAGAGVSEQAAGNVKLRLNDKNYSGGESKYKYYVDSTESSSSSSKEEPVATTTTEKVTTTKAKAPAKSSGGLADFAGTYVSSTGGTIVITSSGEFIVEGSPVAVDVNGSGASLSLSLSNWTSNMNPPFYEVSKGQVVAQFRGSMTTYTLK